MRIMPITGHNAGFTAKGWKCLETVVSKAAQNSIPIDPSLIDKYFDSLFDLNMVSSEISEAQADEQTEVVRDYSSQWGGKETFMGMSHSANAVMVLEGNVVFPRQATDEEIKAEIEKDIAGDVWQDRPDCRQIVESLEHDMHGSNFDRSASAEIKSFVKNPDGTYQVVLHLTINTTSNESSTDARSRMDAKADDARYEGNEWKRDEP